MKTYTQAELADFLEVQPPAISKWLASNIDKVPNLDGHMTYNPSTGRRKFDIHGILAIVNFRKDKISTTLQQELDLIENERKSSEVKNKYGITSIEDALTLISKLESTNTDLKFENAQLKAANEVLKEQNEYIIKTQSNFLNDNKTMLSKLIYLLQATDFKIIEPGQNTDINKNIEDYKL